jgi:hypothetical protein
MAILYYDPKNRVALIIGEIPDSVQRDIMPTCTRASPPALATKFSFAMVFGLAE